MGDACSAARQETKSVSRETTLDRDTADQAMLERVLLRLSAHVASQLRRERLAARTVTLKLRHGDFVTITRSHTLPTATDLDTDIVGAARALLGTAFEDVRKRGRGVRLIGVAATNLTEPPIADLFEPPGTGQTPAFDCRGGPGAGAIRVRCGDLR